ncbi:polysaccharide biosynthesis protein [Nitrosarchaeum sp.]|uniref:polysaccharide biosynthesis protein n=1 Tax=Nitrosarchaeum sp. TaxID=2026886 RepID=UPI00247E9C23|nr:polysaccharide biosynthesis protein [Nitrosarchaeum sp.]MCV0411923.1 polysaccharide biosynthesis protein [Nitrosarchaeum sp.]
MDSKLSSFFKDKQILITGGTGSLGQALTEKLLQMNVERIKIFSRNEEKQIRMENKFHDERLRYFIGDVRDLKRLELAFEDVDIVFHAAALKHVPIVEYNPFEGIKTNVIGSQNVIDASIKNSVEKVICIGTDKAVSPLNTYGATKLLMEKLFVSANYYLNPIKHPTKFIAVRYGNVFGSSGSVVPKFIEQIRKKEKVTITDPNMTRFSITMNEALEFVLESAVIGEGSEVFVPKLKAYSIMELKDALTEIVGQVEHDIIGIRPGEKLREVLINEDEVKYTWDMGKTYLISNPLMYDILEKRHPEVKKIPEMKIYASDMVQRIPKEELKQIINKSNLL